MSRKNAPPKVDPAVAEDPDLNATAADIVADPKAEANESVTAAQASGAVSAPKASGPQIGAMGEYKPASYPVRGGKITRVDS